MDDSPASWIPVVLLMLIAIGFAVGNIAISLLVGPGRTGPGKETTYESGMVPIGDTRKRFNVRFYIVAMIFLVVDVEIVFFYPWASIFSPVIQQGTPRQGNLLLLEMLLFVGLLFVAYVYAWGKGVFRWD
jgi:NADH-quinone oxidoreductase subunit A